MHLKFLDNLEPKLECPPIRNFWKCDQHNIPKKGGVYILIAKTVKFQYPNGKSSIYYIGETTSLYKRLVKQHLKYHTHVKTDKRQDNYIYEARHEYGGAFGGHYCYIEIWRGMTTKALERMVIRQFMQVYHAPPIANGAGVWRWVKKIRV